MQQQLFLFDTQDENNPGKLQLLAAAEAPAAALTEPFATEEKSNEAVPETNLSSLSPEGGTDPFAAVTQLREETVNNMLLLPNKKRGRKSFKQMDAETILVEVPDDEILFQKQYYSTRIVAEWFGITTSQLRQWENEFDILQPKKNARGDRFFRPEDVKNLQLIYHLIRKRKFTMEGARQYLKENKKNLRNTMQLVDILTKFKQFLTELKAISE